MSVDRRLQRASKKTDYYNVFIMVLLQNGKREKYREKKCRKKLNRLSLLRLFGMIIFNNNFDGILWMNKNKEEKSRWLRDKQVLVIY